jgi:hypothetical protein
VALNMKYLFLAVFIQMGHICVSLKDHWSVNEQFVSPLYGKTVWHNGLLLRSFHFQTGTMLLTVMIETVTVHRNWDMFSTCWTRHIQNITCNEHLAGWWNFVVLFERRVIFAHSVPKKKHRIKMCEWCDMSGYTYDMDFKLGKGRTPATTDETRSHNCNTLDRISWRTFHSLTHSPPLSLSLKIIHLTYLIWQKLKTRTRNATGPATIKQTIKRGCLVQDSEWLDYDGLEGQIVSALMNMERIWSQQVEVSLLIPNCILCDFTVIWKLKQTRTEWTLVASFLASSYIAETFPPCTYFSLS